MATWRPPGGPEEGVGASEPQCATGLIHDGGEAALLERAAQTGRADEFLEGRLAHYKQVREVTFIDAIPKSASGKILRRLLKVQPTS